AFQFPLSGAKIVAIRADRLGVPRGVVEQHHAPAVDGLIPDDAGVAADARVTPLPLEHHAAARPGGRYRESAARLVVLRRRLRNTLPERSAHPEDAGGANNANVHEFWRHTTSPSGRTRELSCKPRFRRRSPSCTGARLVSSDAELGRRQSAAATR